MKFRGYESEVYGHSKFSKVELREWVGNVVQFHLRPKVRDNIRRPFCLSTGQSLRKESKEVPVVIGRSSKARSVRNRRGVSKKTNRRIGRRTNQKSSVRKTGFVNSRGIWRAWRDWVWSHPRRFATAACKGDWCSAADKEKRWWDLAFPRNAVNHGLPLVGDTLGEQRRGLEAVVFLLPKPRGEGRLPKKVTDNRNEHRKYFFQSLRVYRNRRVCE